MIPHNKSTKYTKPKRPKVTPVKKIKDEKKFPVRQCPKGHTVCSCSRAGK